MEDIKVCIDLSDVFNGKLVALYNAYRERDENILNEGYRRIIGSDTLTEQILIDSKKQADFNKLLFANDDSKNKLFEMALSKGRLWKNGRTLKVKFIGGNDFVRQHVITYAKEWEKFANIKFDFITTGDAEIRVAFKNGLGSWSYVGTEALCITDQSEPKMNFGWFNDTTSEIEFKRTVTHEFGHCLGCIHEHQSPSVGIKWNKPFVYDYYSKQVPPWDKTTVDHNIFKKFKKKISNSDFDPQSIMLDAIPKELTLDGFSVSRNTFLSSQDKSFIAKLYPKPKTKLALLD
jgi:serralysin